MLRDVIIADTDEEPIELWRHSAALAGGAWFAPFGFAEALRPPGGELLTLEEQLEKGLLSRGQILRSMEDFADKVLPEFGGLGGGA